MTELSLSIEPYPITTSEDNAVNTQVATTPPKDLFFPAVLNPPIDPFVTPGTQATFCPVTPNIFVDSNPQGTSTPSENLNTTTYPTPLISHPSYLDPVQRIN